MRRLISGLYIAAACVVFVQAPAGEAPASPPMMTITFVRQVPRDSADFQRIRTFLRTQTKKEAARAGRESYPSPDKLGSFTLRSVRYRETPKTPESDSDAPVVPSDEKVPVAGDTWSVSTCDGGLFQSWAWTYGGRGWTSTGYAMNSRSSCRDEATSPSA